MPVSAARSAAFDILLRVHGGAYASELLHTERISQLQSMDRGLATALVMGVLRWQSRIDSALLPVIGSEAKFRRLDTEVLIALRLGVFQLQWLDRVPSRAAVNESVELVKRAGKTSAATLVNAVLRKLSAACPLPDHADLAERFAHPAWLLESWQAQFGDEKTRLICEYDQHAPPHHVRFEIRADAGELSEELRAEGIELEAGSLLTSARRVTIGDVTKAPAYQRGDVTIQDEASQLVALLVGKGHFGAILDCCAAPGGKTEVIAQRNPDARITAVEIHDHRAKALAKRLRGRNVNVITGDVAGLLPQLYEKVLADVPCSGTGTLARNPEIKWRVTASDIAALQQKQIGILNSGLDHLSPKGELVYSTCSLQREESEDVVKALLRDRPGVEIVPARDRLAELQRAGELAADPARLISGEFLRTIPGEHDCDGFFAAILRKS